MIRKWVGLLAFGWLLVACSSSSSAQRPDESPATEGQAHSEGCGCPMAGEDGCPGCDSDHECAECGAKEGCPACAAKGKGGKGGHAHGACPMGKACPMHNLPEGTKARVEDTPNGATIRLEAPSSDPASVDAVRQAARKMGKMVVEGCPMMKKMDQSTPPPPARE